ncbi:MAG TPA: Ig-like domain-containing protein [Candidatus Limnocylindria bacterium]|nr:Ig-like domain-containing protein [Candidatus Limnocylindria bacterium]
MRRYRTTSALAAKFESLRTVLSSHRAITRVSLAALSFAFIIALSHQATTQAGPEQAPLIPESLLPQSVGIAVATTDSVTIPFQESMDPASVESAIQVLPQQRVELSWNADRTAVSISPERLWRADERYLVIVGQSSETDGGSPLRGGRRFAFTTETAPAVTDFQVRLAGEDLAAVTALAREDVPSVRSLSRATEAAAAAVVEAGSQPPTRTAKQVSATTAISVSFSADMDRADVESRFAIAPEVAGNLSWNGGNLVFTPSERLEPGGRYTVSLHGAHDANGNPLGGKGNFSFVVTLGAQLVRTDPGLGASDVEPATVSMWFSQPMDVEATNAAFGLTDTSSGALVGGNLDWNDAGTQVTYTPDRAFTGGRTFHVSLGDAALDGDGNPVTAEWSFTTAAAPVAAPAAASATRSTTSTRSVPVVPPPAPTGDGASYAVAQINASRAAYGFGPVVLDGAISAVAYAHAYDQAANGYFSHTGLDGSTRDSRLRAGGISYSWSGENACYLVGRSLIATLDWCHAAFMAEPYPGQFNHIANVLNPNATRVGVGIAQVGSKIVIVWDYTN